MSADAAAATPAPGTGSADGGSAVAVELTDDAVAKLAEAIDDPSAPKPADKADDAAPKDEPAADADKTPVPAGDAKVSEEIRLRRLGTKLAKRREALAKQQAAMAADRQKAQAIDKLTELLAKDRLEAIRALGIEPDEVVDAVLSKKTQKPESPEDAIKRIEKQLADERAARAAAEQQAKVQQAWVEFKTNTTAKLKADESLDLVHAYEAYDEIIDNMAAYHAKHGVVPDPIETAKFWEAEAEKQLTARLAKSKKFALSDRRTDKKTPPAQTGTAKTKAAPSPSLTDKISDTPVGEDDLPDDPDERLRVLMKRMEL
jgi:hypothetical protein